MHRRFFQHLVVLAYLSITAGALFFTLFKIEFPFPEWVTHWSYGMMAPYQGDTSWSADFIYEGQRADGTWEVINLDPYMPYGFGERNVRKFLRVYQILGEEVQEAKFREFATLLRERERAKGRDYQSIRGFFDQWERSPAGYEYLHTPLFTTRTFVIQIP